MPVLTPPSSFFFVLFFCLQFYSKPQRNTLGAKQCFQPQNKFWCPVFQEDVASSKQAKHSLLKLPSASTAECKKRGKGKNLYLRLLATAETAEHTFTSSVYPVIHQEVNRNYDLSNGHLCRDIKLSEGGKTSNPLRGGEYAVIVQGAKPQS